MNNQIKDNQKQGQNISVGRAEMLISGITAEETERIYEIINDLLDESNIISGSADDFHNLSVSIVNKADDYETAYELIQKGLAIHITNTDLIADAIRYGNICGKYNDCDTWYTRLLKITRRRWTWRAYSFLIDYLIEKLDRYKDITDDEYDVKFQEICGYVKEYQEKYPDKEDSWYSEFEIYWNTNERKKAKDILYNITQSNVYCPKTWLRYADILIDDGKLLEAEHILDKLRTDGNIAENQSAPYIYYLHGKCKYEKYLKLRAAGEQDNQMAQDAYDTFARVLNTVDNNSNLYNKAQNAMNQVKMEANLK